MKRLIPFIVLLLASVISTKVYATHVVGAEMSYKWISGNNYQVTLVIYGNCSGSAYTASNIQKLTTGTPVIHVFDSSISQYPQQGDPNMYLFTLSPVVDSIKDVSPYCAADNAQNSCLIKSNPYNGVERYMYQGVITLPHQSAGWVLEYVSFDANCGTATGRGACSNFYSNSHDNIIALNTLNNLNGHNSTPVYSSAKYPAVCSINIPSTFVEDVADPDGDSLVYYTDSIWQNDYNNCYNRLIPEQFTPGYTVSNPITAAIQTGTYNFSSSTGNMSFTANLIGQYAITTHIIEYRNGVIMGSTIRELTLFVLAYGGGTISGHIDSTTLSGANFVGIDTITACPGNVINFTAPENDNHSDSVLVTFNNTIPGASIVVNNNNTPHPSLNFNWNTSGAQGNNYTITANFYINSCPLPSYSSHIYTIIFNNMQASPDTTICAGASAHLRATGATNYTWTVLSGGAPISSLSCTTCNNPVATPGVTTSYVVSTTQPNGCTIYDTVKVTVMQPPATPVATSNGPLCANTTLNLYAGTTAGSYLWTGPAGFNSAQQNPAIANIQVPNSGWYHIVAKNGNCPAPQDSVYVIVTASPRLPVITGNSPVCSGGTINLFAQSNANVAYTWTGPNGFTTGNQNLVLTNAGVQYSGLYTVTASTVGNATCKSAPASYMVYVTPGIFADFHLSADTICQFGIVNVSYSPGGADSLAWNFNKAVLQDTIANNPFHLMFPLPGTQTITLTAFDSGCTDVVYRTIHVNNAPPSTFSTPAVTCFGDPIAVVSNNGYTSNVSFNWNFGAATVLSGSGQGPYSLQYSQPGTYTVALITQNADCTSPVTIDTLLVDAIPDASITTPVDINNICSDDSVHFDGVYVAGSRYQWVQPRFFANDTLSTTYALVRNPGYIYLNIVDQYGCKASDSLYFNPQPCCKIFFPNAFTPNNDGKNDIFKPITIGHHDIAYFRIFNRWGQIVFTSSDEKKGWDGTFDGIPCDMGDYYYVLKYRCKDGEYFEEKGEVVLVR